MVNIQIFDKNADITKRNVAIIVSPVDKNLNSIGVFKFIDYVIYNHRYLLQKKQELIPDINKVEYGDIYVIPEEYDGQGSLMFVVLAPASETNQVKQLQDFYLNVFSKVLEIGATSVRIPSLGHHFFNYNIKNVVSTGLEAAMKYNQLDKIEFFCNDDLYFDLFTQTLNRLQNV